MPTSVDGRCGPDRLPGSGFNGGFHLQLKAVEYPVVIGVGARRGVAGTILVFVAQNHGAFIGDFAPVGSEIAEAEELSAGFIAGILDFVRRVLTQIFFIGESTWNRNGCRNR